MLLVTNQPSIEIMFFRQRAQALGSGLRRKVALRAAVHLEADHEFANLRRAQQGRVKMRMKMQMRNIRIAINAVNRCVERN